MREQGMSNFARRSALKIKKLTTGAVTNITTRQLATLSDMSLKSTQQWTTLQADKREFGVNLTGYFTGQFGVAASARAFARALNTAGVPCVLNKLVSNAHGEQHESSMKFSDSNPYSINLIHVGPDMTEALSQSKCRSQLQGRCNIGVWYWESSNFPGKWLSAFSLHDEIWVTSSYTQQCLSKVSPIPIVKMRYPLFIDTTVLDHQIRRRLGIAEETCMFLNAFDFLSIFERKNPLSLLKAFRDAFSGRDNAVLVINCLNSWSAPDAAKALENESSNLNVKIWKKHLSEREYHSLIAASDCYVSLHRSEGLGLTLAEALYLGRPVIATAYSGNMDFMNALNSLPVKYKLVKLDRDYGSYEKDSLWAEPDQRHAAERMRWVYENREDAREMGAKGSEDIKQCMNLDTASREMKIRLEHIYKTLKIAETRN